MPGVAEASATAAVRIAARRPRADHDPSGCVARCARAASREARAVRRPPTIRAASASPRASIGPRPTSRRAATRGIPAPRARRSSGSPSARSAPPRPPPRSPARPAEDHEPRAGVQVADQRQRRLDVRRAPRLGRGPSRRTAPRIGPHRAGRRGREASASSRPVARSTRSGSSVDAVDQRPQGPEGLELGLGGDPDEQVGALGGRGPLGVGHDHRPPRPPLGHEPAAGLDRVALPVPGWVATGSTPQNTTTSARFLTSPSVAETRPTRWTRQHPGVRAPPSPVDHRADPVGDRQRRGDRLGASSGSGRGRPATGPAEDLGGPSDRLVAVHGPPLDRRRRRPRLGVVGQEPAAADLAGALGLDDPPVLRR